ncbi:hypothetical protein [Vibrio sp. SCSIO 43136]|uniref:substrate-binding periplasmic protein n=1 Tax=Vibrio sp. SCSIO 43136 TaxID=2819101 RepID=UPI0020760D4D|nr:hypothetical protein [Vibrio sp. SCSIO 43136]USD65852.1 hypothetical protein J4N39_03250 [Vibrio sp. SCSIO 43136]
MSKFLYVLCFLSTLLSPSINAKVFTVGYFSLPPHSYSVRSQANGAAVEYFEYLFSETPHKIEWLGPLPFPRLINYLKSGAVDAALIVSKGQDRQDYIYFPEFSFISVQPTIGLVKQHPLDKITDIKDVLPLKMGFLEGANLPPLLNAYHNEIQIEYLSGKNWVRQNLHKVLKGRLDAAFDLNETTMQFEAIKLGVEQELKFLSLPEKPKQLFTGFSKFSQSGKELREIYQQQAEKKHKSYSWFLDSHMERFRESKK